MQPDTNASATDTVPDAAAAPSGRMRAILQERFGGPEVLSIGEAPIPTPGPGEVLVRTIAVDVSAGDRHLVAGKPYVVRVAGYGLLRPKRPIPGTNLAGVVVALGPGVNDRAIGDAVLGENLRGGGLAEYAILATRTLAAKPAGVTFEQAATLPWAVNALQALRDHGRVGAKTRVLVHGASGGVGHFAVQIARSLGAEVTATTRRGANVAWLEELGAERAIDTSRSDPLATAERFDAILDLVGDRSLGDHRRALAGGGRYVSIGGEMGDWVGPFARMGRVWIAGALRSKPFVSMIGRVTSDDLNHVVNEVSLGRLVPGIGARYGLAEAAEAFARAARGGVPGKTVVLVSPDEARG